MVSESRESVGVQPRAAGGDPRVDMPMFHFRYEAMPKQTHPKHAEYAGAMICCWIQRETQADAESVARGLIGDKDWRITKMEHAGLITRETQSSEGMQYFEQAEIDREVFVIHTWPIRAPDDKNAA
jgi:hypothetical protein